MNTAVSLLPKAAPDPIAAIGGAVSALKGEMKQPVIDLSVGVGMHPETGQPYFPDWLTKAEFIVALQKIRSNPGIFADQPELQAILNYVLNPDDTGIQGAGYDFKGIPNYRKDVSTLLDMKDNRNIAFSPTAGGSGAVEALMGLLRSSDITEVIIGSPTWPSHGSIAAKSDLQVHQYPHLNNDGSLNLEGLISAIQKNPKSAVLLQPIGHNPTGVDFSPEDIQQLLPHLENRVALLDAAYLGYQGSVQEDFQKAIVPFTNNTNIVTMLALGLSKTLHLYGDHRAGAAMVFNGGEAQEARNMEALMLTLKRSGASAVGSHAQHLLHAMLQYAYPQQQQWLQDIAGNVASNRQAITQALPAELQTYLQHADGGLFSSIPCDGEVNNAAIAHALSPKLGKKMGWAQHSKLSKVAQKGEILPIAAVPMGSGQLRINLAAIPKIHQEAVASRIAEVFAQAA